MTQKKNIAFIIVITSCWRTDKKQFHLLKCSREGLPLRLGTRVSPAACCLPLPSSTRSPAARSYLTRPLSCGWGQRSSQSMAAGICPSSQAASWRMRYSSFGRLRFFYLGGRRGGAVGVFATLVQAPPRHARLCAGLRSSGLRPQLLTS